MSDDQPGALKQYPGDNSPEALAAWFERMAADPGYYSHEKTRFKLAAEFLKENTSLRERAEKAEAQCVMLTSFGEASEDLLMQQIASLRSLNEGAAEVIRPFAEVAKLFEPVKLTGIFWADEGSHIGISYADLRLAASWSEKHAATRYDRAQSAQTE